MRLLIIGGTVFVGRHLTTAAIERGHTVTLFHRGKHNPGLFGTAVETITGDRTSPEDLKQLLDHRWDAVIDTCGYVPRIVGLSASALAAAVQTYCFISTVSVYSDWSAASLPEDAALGTLEDTTTEQVTGETYGPLKVLCENAVRDTYGDARTLIVRPGLIVGPNDISDRFTYWPHRVAQGGDILAPGDPDVTTQFIDVRDLAEWTIRLLEAGKTGTYNGDGPAVRFGDLLPACRTAAGLSEADARFVYIPEATLEARGVQPWSELPLWIPRSMNHGALIDISHSVNNGLTFRPLSQTVADTLAWDKTRTDTDTAYKNTLTRDKEAEILAG